MKQNLSLACVAAIVAGSGASLVRAADFSDEAAAGAVAAPNDRVISAFLAAGVAVKPEFEGSDKYEAVPLLLANVTWGGVEVQLRGLKARVDLLADSPWDVGPVVNYRGKRDDDVSGPVRRLKEIDGAVEAGGFVGYAFGGGRDGQGEIRLETTVLQDVSGEHDGFTVSGGVSYAALRWGPVFANVDAQTTYASKDFNRTYFGVTQAGSIASGLKAYRPGAGFKDVSAGVTAGYQFNEQWGLIARAEVTRLVGDAADSPIAKDGAKTSALLGLGVSYRY